MIVFFKPDSVPRKIDHHSHFKKPGVGSCLYDLPHRCFDIYASSTTCIEKDEKEYDDCFVHIPGFFLQI